MRIAPAERMRRGKGRRRQNKPLFIENPSNYSAVILGYANRVSRSAGPPLRSESALSITLSKPSVHEIA